jgi:hypothetical protein
MIYKSPAAALCWSIVMTGFGQMYNGQYIFGTFLFLFEIIVNGASNLNLSIVHSFLGHAEASHDVFDHQWGLFYPSTYAFSMWHAYNKAITINHKQQKKDPPKETYLTSFFIAFVIGMNLGVYYHSRFDFTNHFLLTSPIFNGLLFGLISGFIAHFIEKKTKKRKVNST